MPKPIVRPKVFYLRDVYASYIDRILKAHPTWWGKYEKRLKLRNCYIYAQENGKVVLKMSWMLWKDMIESFYHKAKYAIIHGETLRIGGNLGKVRAIRVQRDYSNPVVDWGATFKANIKMPDGKVKKIYYTDEDYCRIQWAKFGMISNETSYNFHPADKNMTTGKGFKAEFSAALLKDPLLKYKFKFYPIIRRKKEACNTPTVQCETLLAV